MNRQGQKIWNITFEPHEAPLFIPPEMLEEVISGCRKGKETLLGLDRFFPEGLVAYLEQVLDMNRHLIVPLREGSENRTGTSWYSGDEVFSFILLQLGGLRINRRLWFSQLRYTGMPNQDHILFAGYTQEAQKISREGGLFLYQPKNHKKSRVSFVLDPASKS